jgi:hypothetical protein
MSDPKDLNAVMPEPKDITIDKIQAPLKTEAEAILKSPPPEAAELPSPPTSTFSYATRFAAQRYHPVILIGSSAAGKTVLLLSLLAYFKGGESTKRLSVVFGDDLFKSAEKTLRDSSKNYFDRTVAEYIRGRTGGVTKLVVPMFIPAKVYGETQQDLKFAFMESSGEDFQPKDSPGKEYTPAFQPDLASLLLQYPDGISFVWVAPHVPATVPRVAIDPKLDNYDPGKLITDTDESLRFAFANYTTLRGRNSARDTHMLLVTKWDTYESKTLTNDIRTVLDRANDEPISHEVESYLEDTYGRVYGAFASLKSPADNKVIFRYSAGLFDNQLKTDNNIESLLRTYPRDVWNWLYDGMKTAHDWDLEPGPLIHVPPPPRPNFLQMLQQFVRKIIG